MSGGPDKGDNATIRAVDNYDTGKLQNNIAKIDLENGSTLTVLTDVNNSASISTSTNSSGPLGGNSMTVGTLNNSGSFLLNGGPDKGDSAVIGSIVNSNNGKIDLEYASTLNVNGDLYNAGQIRTGYLYGGNVLNISGKLTNDVSGLFFVDGLPSDSVTVGSIDNKGHISLEPGSPSKLAASSTAESWILKPVRRR